MHLTLMHHTYLHCMHALYREEAQNYFNVCASKGPINFKLCLSFQVLRLKSDFVFRLYHLVKLTVVNWST